jgi:hypothetical protein
VTAALVADASEFGGVVWDRARRDLAAARHEILASALGWCASPLPWTRRRAFECARAALPGARPEDRAPLERALAEARASARSGDRWLRETSLRLLVEADDPAAARAVVDALRREGEDRWVRAASIWIARDLALRRPERRDEIAGELVALLEGDDGEAVAALRKVTGEGFGEPEEWREWWRSRAR